MRSLIALVCIATGVLVGHYAFDHHKPAGVAFAAATVLFGLLFLRSRAAR